MSGSAGERGLDLARVTNEMVFPHCGYPVSKVRDKA
jgi:hypothetical protein